MLGFNHAFNYYITLSPNKKIMLEQKKDIKKVM